MKVDSIIFDLDGTLWDSTAGCLVAWNKVIKDLDYIENEITQKEIQSVFGVKHDLIFGKLYPLLTKEQQDEVMELCFREENDYLLKNGGELYSDLEEVLKELSSKYKLFIVSNCQKGYIETFLGYTEFKDYFQDIECSGNTGKAKSENINEIIKRNNLKNPVYVGDTMGDYEAAQKSKIPFIFAEYGFGKVEEAQYKISSLIDLGKVIGKI